MAAPRRTTHGASIASTFRSNHQVKKENFFDPLATYDLDDQEDVQESSSEEEEEYTLRQGNRYDPLDLSRPDGSTGRDKHTKPQKSHGELRGRSNISHNSSQKPTVNKTQGSGSSNERGTSGRSGRKEAPNRSTSKWRNIDLNEAPQLNFEQLKKGLKNVSSTIKGVPTREVQAPTSLLPNVGRPSHMLQRMEHISTGTISSSVPREWPLHLYNPKWLSGAGRVTTQEGGVLSGTLDIEGDATRRTSGSIIDSKQPFSPYSQHQMPGTFESDSDTSGSVSDTSESTVREEQPYHVSSPHHADAEQQNKNKGGSNMSVPFDVSTQRKPSDQIPSFKTGSGLRIPEPSDTQDATTTLLTPNNNSTVETPRLPRQSTRANHNQSVNTSRAIPTSRYGPRNTRQPSKGDHPIEKNGNKDKIPPKTVGTEILGETEPTKEPKPPSPVPTDSRWRERNNTDQQGDSKSSKRSATRSRTDKDIAISGLKASSDDTKTIISQINPLAKSPPLQNNEDHQPSKANLKPPLGQTKLSNEDDSSKKFVRSSQKQSNITRPPKSQPHPSRDNGPDSDKSENFSQGNSHTGNHKGSPSKLQKPDETPTSRDQRNLNFAHSNDLPVKETPSPSTEGEKTSSPDQIAAPNPAKSRKTTKDTGGKTQQKSANSPATSSGNDIPVTDTQNPTPDKDNDFLNVKPKQNSSTKTDGKDKLEETKPSLPRNVSEEMNADKYSEDDSTVPNTESSGYPRKRGNLPKPSDKDQNIQSNPQALNNFPSQKTPLKRNAVQKQPLRPEQAGSVDSKTGAADRPDNGLENELSDRGGEGASDVTAPCESSPYSLNGGGSIIMQEPPLKPARTVSGDNNTEASDTLTSGPKMDADPNRDDTRGPDVKLPNRGPSSSERPEKRNPKVQASNPTKEVSGHGDTVTPKTNASESEVNNDPSPDPTSNSGAEHPPDSSAHSSPRLEPDVPSSSTVNDINSVGERTDGIEQELGQELTKTIYEMLLEEALLEMLKEELGSELLSTYSKLSQERKNSLCVQAVGKASTEVIEFVDEVIKAPGDNAEA